MTAMDQPAPVHLELPPAQPEPVVGCVVCLALIEQRRQAATKGDYSKVSDCNVGLVSHTHGPARRKMT
ncbi:hypothetical protein SAMN05444521_6041 [Streptomyces sp. 3214.6]|nr:hypothetical protein SAMN05444521_6041 [Streptomyces sp. 3214.6]